MSSHSPRRSIPPSTSSSKITCSPASPAASTTTRGHQIRQRSPSWASQIPPPPHQLPGGRASAGSVAAATAMADRLLPHEPGSPRDCTRGTRSWLRPLGELSLWRSRAQTRSRVPGTGVTRDSGRPGHGRAAAAASTSTQERRHGSRDRSIH